MELGQKQYPINESCVGCEGADADEMAFKADDSMPNMSKLSSTEVDISRFLPSKWDAWLAEDADVGTQQAHNDLHQAGAATAKVLDECNVLSGVLRDELAKTDRLLKQ